MAFNFRKIFATTAILLGAIFTAILPAYGQQEVDPTWYNPWPSPASAVVRNVQPAAAAQTKRKTRRVVSSTQRAAKVRMKRTSSAVRPS